MGRLGVWDRARRLLVYGAAALRRHLQARRGLGRRRPSLLGPAINALAIILTARVLGIELGTARAVGAVAFSVLVGLAMAWIFRHEERERAAQQAALPPPEAHLSLARQAAFFAVLVGILIFANWHRAREAFGPGSSPPSGGSRGFRPGASHDPGALVRSRALEAGAIGAATALAGRWSPASNRGFRDRLLALSVVLARDEGELGEWFSTSWEFAKQILPLLVGGVLVAGLLLGRRGTRG